MSFLLEKGQQCQIWVSEQESEAVQIAVSNLKKDLGKVLAAAVTICRQKAGDAQKTESNIAKIVVGTLGISEEITKQIDVSKLQDEKGVFRKEAYMIRVCKNQLLIVGTDRRGTIYGIYEFCEYMGVSPWYFFADVPIKKKEEIELPADYEKIDFPSIEYRGIFINDEEELEAWVQNYMGESTIGVKTYEKIFELLLRLRANYIWPAMHVNSFNVVVENGALAEKMGIVVGTSHCDMLMRSNNREWKPWIAKKGYTDVQYDYSIPGRNRDALKEYWRESVEQNRDFEVSYTLGMRGIHDSGFETRELEGKSEEEVKAAKVKLLTTIIHDQQDILNKTLGHDVMMTFIPYKEVLELYDSGLDIPEELTLVWANDNYGYIRRYPSGKEKGRKGGNGIYYHNSYWSPPSMSYVFFCSIPLAHTRNELRKAYEEGIRKLWVLNIGAIKPLEQEISFFAHLAWEIGKEGALTEDVDAFVEDWINKTFSGNIGAEVSAMLNDFSQLTNVRKVENMDYDAFSQTAYGDEAVVRIHKYEELFQRGNELYAALPAEEKDAFFQMVLMRIHAAYFTNMQYYYGDRSTLMHSKGKMQAAAFYTQKALAFDDARRKMLVYYNTIMSQGKWNGILNPEGFPPPRAAMMPICTPPLAIPKEPKMFVDVWNEEAEMSFVRPGQKWIEIANLGEGEIHYEIQTPQWVKLSKTEGRVNTEERIMVQVEDASQNLSGMIVVHNLMDGAKVEIPIKVVSIKHSCNNIEEDGKVTVEADSVNCEGTGFHKIKRLGRGIGSLVEANANSETNNPLRYQVLLSSSGDATLEIHRFPSLDSTGRIRIGVSVDDDVVQLVETPSTDEWRGNWKKNVLNNVDRLYLQLSNMEAGEHTIAFHPVDKYFAFSRFVIYTKERKPNNYIGITGNQELPRLWDAEAWIKSFYGELTLYPRPVEYAQIEKEEDTLVKADWVKQDVVYAETVKPQWYLQEGSSIFAEKGGAISIDAATVLAQSSYAYTSGYDWQHCNSESFGRSGLAMYIRQPELKWELEEAPALNYRVQCSGGKYTVWLLAKFNMKEEAFFGVGVDGIPLCWEQLYNKGCLWRYEAEQIYRWVPIAEVELKKGEHVLQIFSLVSGLRFDRIYLSMESEMPPMDSEWKR